MRSKTWVQNSEKETKRKALLARAEQGDPDAIVELAVFYHGEGKEKECKKWITNGARLRDPYCMGQEAIHLYYDRAKFGTNVYQRIMQAMYFMMQAAEAGHIISIRISRNVEFKVGNN